MRKCGVLCPVFSLPSPYGIGTFGKSAYEFVDQLEKAGQSYWQILPLGQTGYGDSPYQSFSTFAGNPYFIDLDMLKEEGLLEGNECGLVEVCENPAYVDYEKMYYSRYKVLRLAFARFHADGEKRYAKFVKKNSHWLEDYALYMAVKDYFGGKPFSEWDGDIRLRKKKAIARYKEQLASEMDFYKFMQYCFSRQWKKLKKYANKKGIEIIGDIPIYVAFDSADTWANPEMFQLDDAGLPIAVAGCPPDCFAETGQLWGNPLYDWEYHRKTEYEWWMQRFAHCYKLYDVVRIDHFRGFDEYWFVPYGDENAVGGHWVKGPGYDLFKTMRAKLGQKKVIAEDLGFMTGSVVRLVKRTKFPNMKILEFAFEAWQNNEHLPHNYDKNCVVYTGTHDNETIMGFLSHMSKEDLKFTKKYLHCKDETVLCREIIRAGVASAADTVIIPIQDWLELGNEARINLPSTLGENWKWRMDRDALSDKLARRIYKMTKVYGRL